MKKYIFHYKYKFIFIVMLLIAVAGLEVYGAVIMANVINAVINKHLSKFYTQMIFWLLIWSIIIIIRYSLSIFETKFEQSIANKIRADIVETISHESYQEYNSSDNSKFVSWMNNDTQQIVDKGITYLYIVVEAISSIILSLITLWKYNIWIMLASIFLAFITLFLPKILNNKLAKTSSELSTENEKFVALSSNLLSNFNMLFSFNALSLMKEKISGESKKLKSAYVNQAKVYGGIAALGFVCNVLSQVGLTGLSGILAYQGIISIGAIFSITNLTGNIFNGVGNLPNYLSYIKSTEPIFNKFNLFIKKNYDNQAELKGTSESPFLEMKNIEFSYPNATKKTINNFSYKFERNKKYLLDGASGCGKSTILKLLAGFYSSYKGKILLKDNSLKDYSPKQLHENIFYLDQHPQVIKGSVRDNLNLTNNYSDNKLKQVLHQVHLDNSDEFLDKYIEKNGSSLSGGQLQRLALARALLRDFDIFLMDEGTTGVEEKTAIELEQILLKDINKTVIVVNHNLSQENRNLFDAIISLS